MSDEKTPAAPESDGPPPVPGVEIFDAPGEPVAEATPTPAYAETPREPQVAHPALRALAFAMDGIGTVAATILVVFGSLGAAYEFAFVAILLVPFLSALLCTVLTATLGATPGKAILGLRVVHAVTGRRLGAWALVRSLVIVAPVALSWLAAAVASRIDGLPGDSFFAVALLPPIAGWIALLVVLSVRPRHRGLQDLAGRSVVVRR